jgi:hypothetical protein
MDDVLHFFKLRVFFKSVAGLTVVPRVVVSFATFVTSPRHGIVFQGRCLQLEHLSVLSSVFRYPQNLHFQDIQLT